MFFITIGEVDTLNRVRYCLACPGGRRQMGTKPWLLVGYKINKLQTQKTCVMMLDNLHTHVIVPDNKSPVEKKRKEKKSTK